MKDTPLRRFRLSVVPGANVFILFGSDPGHVANASLELVSQWRAAHPASDETHLTPTDVANDPATLLDFFRETSLFGGARHLRFDGVRESHRAHLSQLFVSAAEVAQDVANDSVAILSSASLRTKSPLLGEARQHPRVVTISCYPDAAATGDALLQHLRELALSPLDPAAEAAAANANAMEIGAVRMFAEKLRLYVAPKQVFTADDIAACQPEDPAARHDVAHALLSTQPESLLACWRAERDAGLDPIAFQITLGRALNDLEGATRAIRPSRVFWALKEPLAAAQRRKRDLNARFQTASVWLFEHEKKSRTGKALNPWELERLCIRIARLLRG